MCDAIDEYLSHIQQLFQDGKIDSIYKQLVIINEYNEIRIKFEK